MAGCGAIAQQDIAPAKGFFTVRRLLWRSCRNWRDRVFHPDDF